MATVNHQKPTAPANPPAALGQVYQNTDSDWPFAMADFRACDRAISDEEIEELSA